MAKNPALFWQLATMILLVVMVVGLVVIKERLALVAPRNHSVNYEAKSEDDLSQYSVPADVLAAIAQSKSTNSPVLGVRSDGPSFHVPILMYHYVEHVADPKDTIRISLNTLPEVLDQQLTTLQQAGYTAITMSDLANALDGIANLPSKPVVLTFDDGYRDFATDAFPILKKHGVKSVAYIVTGLLDRPNYLTEKQLAEIAGSGLVEIGAHTVHHVALAKGWHDRVWQEIMQSKVWIEGKLNMAVTTFAYPYGSFDLQAVQLVRQAGFRTAVSTVAGATHANATRLFAFRVRPGRATGPVLLKILDKN